MATPFPFGSGNTLLASQLNAITTLPINDQTASYVALVGDVGKRIVMNVATANTVTINNSVFAVGDTIFIANKGAGTSTVTAGAGVTINTSSSLALAQHGGGTLVALSASVFTFFSGGGATYGTATGGIGAPTAITVSSVNYNLLTFTSDATLTVTRAGLFDLLLVGGGGGGGRSFGGGGGAGGLVETSAYYFATGSYGIIIGAGGTSPGAPGAGGVGGNTSVVTGGLVTSIVALGGGRGGYQYSVGSLNGGSGGGAWHASDTRLTIQNSTYKYGVGFDGGLGGGSAVGGGGGAGSIGTSTTGGNGLQTTFNTGSPVYFAAGGPGEGGTGGLGFNTNANTGNGGAGLAVGQTGVCYIRFKS